MQLQLRPHCNGSKGYGNPPITVTEIRLLRQNIVRPLTSVIAGFNRTRALKYDELTIEAFVEHLIALAVRHGKRTLVLDSILGLSAVKHQRTKIVRSTASVCCSALTQVSGISCHVAVPTPLGP